MTSGLAPKKLTSSRNPSKGKKAGPQGGHQSAPRRRLASQRSARSLHSEALSRSASMTSVPDSPTSPATASTRATAHAQTRSKRNSQSVHCVFGVLSEQGFSPPRALLGSPLGDARRHRSQQEATAAPATFRRPQALSTTQLIRRLSQATAEDPESADAGQQGLLQALVDGIGEDLDTPRSPQAMTLAEAALERSQKLLECLRSSGLGLSEDAADDCESAYRVAEPAEDIEEPREAKAMQTVEVPVDMLRMMSSMWEELQQQRSASSVEEKVDSVEDREAEEARYDTYCREQRQSAAYSSASTSFGTASAGGRSLSSLASWCSTPCLSQGGSPTTKSRRPSSTTPFMLRSTSSLPDSTSEPLAGQVLTRTSSLQGVIHNHDGSGEESLCASTVSIGKTQESLCASTTSIGKPAPAACSTIKAPLPVPSPSSTAAEALCRLAARAPRYSIPGRAVQRTMAVANAHANPGLLPRPAIVPRCTAVVAAPLVLKSVSVTATYGPA